MTDDRSSSPDPSLQSAVPPPPKRRRWLRWLIEITLFLGVFLAVRTYMAPKVPESLAHAALPLITAPTVSGGTATIGLPGQPTALVFWATWCSICHVELPWLNDLSKTHRIITVAMQSGDTQQVQKYLAEHQLNDLTVINDPDGAIARKFGVSVTPTMFFIAPDGHIAMAETGITSAWGIRLRLWWLAHF